MLYRPDSSGAAVLLIQEFMGGASLEQTRFHHKMAVCLIHVLYEKGEIPRSVYKEALRIAEADRHP